MNCENVLELSEDKIKKKEEYIQNFEKIRTDLSKDLEEEIKKALIEVEGFIPGPRMIQRHAKRVVSEEFKGYMDYLWREKLLLRVFNVQVERTENGDGTMNFKVNQKIEKFWKINIIN